MALMRSPPGVPIPVPQYRRSRSLYEWPGLAGSPGDAILSAVKWVYDGGAAFDEAFDRDGDARARYRGIVGVLESFTQGEVSRRERVQKLALMDQGITFTVYGEKEGLRVQPKTTPTQTVLSFTLAVGPRARVYRYVDWNDDVTHHFTITKFHDRIEVTATSLVETRPSPVALADLGPAARDGEVPYPLVDFLAFDGPVRLTPALRAAYGALALPRGAALGEQALAMSAALRGRFEYQKDVTHYDSTTEDFLKLGRGVCQDFAHLMLRFLRLSGIPCRYV